MKPNKANRYEKTANPQQGRPWRFYIVTALGMVLFVCLASRLVFLQVVNQDFLRDQGEKRSLRELPLYAHRGVVLDRNGEPLAVSTPVDSIWINPKQIIADKVDLTPLAQLLNIPLRELKGQVKRQASREYVFVKRHVTPQLGEQVKGLRLSGVYTQREYKRYYPAAEVTAHVVGFTNIDDAGQEGIELAFDSTLRGEAGKTRVLQDRYGRLVKDLGLLEAAQPGKDVSLSIDLRLQYQAYRELKAAVRQHGAKSGSLVMVDVVTGEVLAMVNQPAFNPNNRKDMEPGSVRNRAVTDIMEPGSTVKPFTVSAALMSGDFSERSVIATAPGYMRIGPKTIRDHNNYGDLTLEGILTKSSNIGAAKLALDVGGLELWQTMQAAGLGAMVGIELPGENAGKVAARVERMSNIETATLSYGYGLAITPLQLAQAYQTLANGGVKQHLTILKRDKIPVGEKVIPEKIARQVIHMMESVVTREGTARRAAVEGYRIAGKTGTVHKVGSQGYLEDQYMSLFAGVSPADNPRVATIVLIDEPSGKEYYGGEVAAPVFARVNEASMRLLNVQATQSAQRAVAGGPR